MWWFWLTWSCLLKRSTKATFSSPQFGSLCSVSSERLSFIICSMRESRDAGKWKARKIILFFSRAEVTTWTCLWSTAICFLRASSGCCRRWSSLQGCCRIFSSRHWKHWTSGFARFSPETRKWEQKSLDRSSSRRPTFDQSDLVTFSWQASRNYQKQLIYDKLFVENNKKAENETWNKIFSLEDAKQREF